MSVSPADALRALRKARATRRWEGIDFFEALYRVYMAGFALLGVALVLGRVIGDGRVMPGTVERVAELGPVLAGMAIALAVAVGIRSGARGGPMILERAEVRNVLLGPIRRSEALRRPAVRMFVRMTVSMSVVGGITGLLASGRVPGGAWSWAMSVALVGGSATVLALSAAVIISGLRLRQSLANLLAGAVLAPSVFVEGSPWTQIGRAALSPLTDAPALWTVLLAAGAIAVAATLLGGLSLERAERRSSVVGGMQVAAATHDIRTVLLLHRQLAQELPRARPLVRRRRRIPLTLLGACWRRGWQGFARWPSGRWIRSAALAVGAGVAAGATVQGTTPAIVLAGLASFLLGVDVCESLAQDVDHPDLEEGYPVRVGLLRIRHLIVPAIVLTVLMAIGLRIGARILGAGSALELFALPGVVLTSLAAGALALVLPPPDPFVQGFSPEMSSARMIGRATRLPIAATLGFVPFFFAARFGVAQAAGTAVLTVIVGGLMVLFVGTAAAAQRTLARVGKRLLHHHDEGTGRVVSDERTVVETFSLSKSYLDLPALAPVSLRFRTGELVALVGSNGAGKSTLLRLIAGLLEATDGRAFVRGHAAGSLGARKALTYVGDDPVLFDDLSVDEHVSYLGALHGVTEEPEELLDRLRLTDRREDLPSRFSRGLRQKTSLVLGLMRKSDALLVDEPFVGLDPPAQLELTELLVEAARRGQCVVVATHQLQLLDRADRCVVLREGGVVYDGPPGDAPLDEVLG